MNAWTRVAGLLCALYLLAGGFGWTATDDAIAVVAAASGSADSLTMAKLKLIYNRKTQIDGHGTRWVPVNLPVNDPLRRAFSRAVFDALPETLEEYWNIQYFHGINPPEVLGSEEAVLRFVAATPGAIGYIRAKSVDPRVKVLLLLSSPANAE